jgi:hypothetical protein
MKNPAEETTVRPNQIKLRETKLAVITPGTVRTTPAVRNQPDPVSQPALNEKEPQSPIILLRLFNQTRKQALPFLATSL